jgi:hypothetical protein
MGTAATSSSHCSQPALRPLEAGLNATNREDRTYKKTESGGWANVPQNGDPRRNPRWHQSCPAAGEEAPSAYMHKGEHVQHREKPQRTRAEPWLKGNRRAAAPGGNRLNQRGLVMKKYVPSGTRRRKDLSRISHLGPLCSRETGTKQPERKTNAPGTNDSALRPGMSPAL